MLRKGFSNLRVSRITESRYKSRHTKGLSYISKYPLNAILGMAEGLQEVILGDINYRQQKSLKTITSSGSHLLELINDILDVAKIESGQIDLEYSSLDLNTLGKSSLAFVKQQAMKKGIQLTMAVNPQLPCVEMNVVCARC